MQFGSGAGPAGPASSRGDNRMSSVRRLSAALTVSERVRGQQDTSERSLCIQAWLPANPAAHGRKLAISQDIRCIILCLKILNRYRSTFQPDSESRAPVGPKPGAWSNNPAYWSTKQTKCLIESADGFSECTPLLEKPNRIVPGWSKKRPLDGSQAAGVGRSMGANLPLLRGFAR